MSLAVWIDQTTLSVLAMIVLVVIISVGLWYINDLKREAKEDEEPATDEQRLEQFERARDAGELSQAEFERVRDALFKTREAASPPPPRAVEAQFEPRIEAPQEPPPAGGP